MKVDLAKINYLKTYETLGIDKSKLPDLSKHYKRAQALSCAKPWGSPERYVDVLYWMKFEKKYDWYDIAEIFGSDHVSIRTKFRPFGWDNNLQTYKECEEKLQETIDSVKAQLQQIQTHFKVFQSREYLEKESVIIDTPCKDNIKKTFSVSTERELFKTLYYLLRYSGFTTKEIALYYSISPDTLKKHLNRFNIALTHKEASERREARGNGNHAQSRVSFSKQLVRHAISSGLSNNYELLFRDLITSYIPDFFDIYKYEIIIGVHSFSIIPPQEIDIPILIIDKCRKNTFKYAIELNGRIWHENKKHHKRDLKKNAIIQETEWKLITIKFQRMTSSSNKLKQAFINLTRNICNILADDVQSINKVEWKRKEIEITTI